MQHLKSKVNLDGQVQLKSQVGDLTRQIDVAVRALVGREVETHRSSDVGKMSRDKEKLLMPRVLASGKITRQAS